MQVYFVDVVKCVNEVCYRDDAFSAAHCLECASPQVNESAHLNSVGNLIYHRLTDQPPAIVGPGYAGVGSRSGLKYSASEG